MPARFPDMSAFATVFAAAYRGFMKEAGVTGAHLAATLDRNAGYVSERINGKRPLDLDDVDALAELTPGWTGVDLMIELSRRARLALGVPAGELIEGSFGVGTSTEDEGLEDELPAAAKKKSRDRGEQPETP